MKYNFTFLALLLLAFGMLAQDSNTAQWRQDNLAFRQKLNQQYGDSLRSPLLPADRAQFDSLPFFPLSPHYTVQAALDYPDSARVLEMPTSTERLARYRHYATAVFWLEGQEHRLPLYRKEPPHPLHPRSLFVPFTDSTNGQSSYGGGRYLDLQIPSGDSLWIDFNRAYNPYCAYNGRYSCPIPPRANHLTLAIPAGVRYSSY